MTSRREFFVRAAGGAAALFAVSNAGAQQGGRATVHDSVIVKDSSNLFAMNQDAALPVRLPPKPNATPSMTDRERDELEHHIHCQCGCTLSVFICRTTDFSCQVSPAMHRDIVQLVHDGYGAQEIIDAFVNVYGERALMAPKAAGFNILAWVMPGIGVIVGGSVLAMLLRRWGQRSRLRAAAPQAFVASRGDTDATADELAELEAAVRGEDDPR
jgi:cytochrome c-type biogenesis protein CcmH